MTKPSTICQEFLNFPKPQISYIKKTYFSMNYLSSNGAPRNHRRSMFGVFKIHKVSGVVLEKKVKHSTRGDIKFILQRHIKCVRISYCHGHGSEGLDLRVFSALDMEELGNNVPEVARKVVPAASRLWRSS